MQYLHLHRFVLAGALGLAACATGQISDAAPGGAPGPTVYAADGGVVVAPPAAPGCKSTPVPRTSSALFTNLQADCYYCRQPTFVDLVKAAECFRSGWTTCAQGRSAFPTDASGWPLQTPSGDAARSVLGPAYRTGTYVVRWQGKGTFAIAPMAENGVSPMAAPLNVKATASGEATFEVTRRGSIVLEITATDADDHLRDFSVIHSDLVEQAACDPFYPELVGYLQPFAGLRMMDWTSTNDSKVVKWADRIPAYAYREAGRVETAIALCNRVQRDCWLNVPHQADDDYVERLARLVLDRLDPGLKAYIEYSNETWNGQFAQYQYCVDRGQALQLAGSSPYAQGARYHAYRAKQIFAIFDDVFGDEARARVVRVLAGQTGETWLLGEHLDQIGGSGELDVYATAPYIGPGSLDGFGGKADAWTLDQLFDYLFNTSLPSAVSDMNKIGQAVAGYSAAISFVAYEGGQHLAGGQASAHARELYVQAQTDPRMSDLYQRYLSAWRSSGGRQFAIYNALGPIDGQYGSWGLKPSLDTPDDQAPKYQGLKRWDTSNPRWW